MPRLATWARRPWAWVLLQVLVVLAWKSVAGQLEPQEHIDSRTYLRLATDASMLEILGSIRSLGFPLLLRGLLWISGSLDALPALNLLLFGVAAVAWCAALERFGLSKLAALAAGSWPLYSQLFRELLASVMSDVPAAAMVLLVLSAFLLLLREPHRWRWWLALGVATFLAYQLRPANVFLVVLMPLAAGARRSLAFRLAVVTIAPLLLFCVLRLVLVGHFGLVPFTGHNLSGITSSMLTPELVAELPDAERPLATAILDERIRRGRLPLTASSSFEEWERFYIWNSWGNAIGLVKVEWKSAFLNAESESAPPDMAVRYRDVYIEKRLFSHCMAVLRARPGLYYSWLWRAWAHALSTTARQPWIVVPLGLWVLGWAWSRRGAAPRRDAMHHESLRKSLGLLGLGVVFYLGAMGLVLLIETPFWRYLAAAELLLPGALMAVTAEWFQSGIGGQGRPPLQRAGAAGD